MESTATKGVWLNRIKDKVKVVYDTNRSTIQLIDERPNKSGFIIHCEGGITTSLVSRVNRLLHSAYCFEIAEKRQPEIQTA